MPARPQLLSSCGQAISTDILHSIETTSFDILNGTQAALKCQGSPIIPPKVRYIAIDDVYLVSIATTIFRQAQRI